MKKTATILLCCALSTEAAAAGDPVDPSAEPTKEPVEASADESIEAPPSEPVEALSPEAAEAPSPEPVEGPSPEPVAAPVPEPAGDTTTETQDTPSQAPSRRATASPAQKELADWGAEVVVSAERWETSAQDVPMSVSVVTGDTVELAAMSHAEDAIKLTPNVDWVGASNRPRFLLIRGVGDLGTGNVVTNPSIGVLVDEVDLSGFGAALTLLDTERVEVLRGPQGTLYGPNALGGLLKVESRAPEARPSADAEIRVGAYDTVFVTAAGGGSLTPRNDIVKIRAAAQYHRTDGFMQNKTLDRNDTAGRDELSTRVRVRVDPTPNFRLDLIGSYIDVDDGYDHWSITPYSRKTWSDKPGRDAQRTGMGAMLMRWDVGKVRLVSNTSVSSSLWNYSADFDWFGVDTPPPPGSLAPEGYTVDLYNEQDTRQDGFTQEIRVSSRPDAGPWDDRVRWLAGAYVNGVRQEMSTVLYFFGDALQEASNESTYRRLSAAGFAQVDIWPIERLTITAGGRVERALQDYMDLTGFEDEEGRWLFGWRGAARLELAPEASLYVSASQSSKLGGFNLAPDAPVRNYRPEIDRSFELGVRTQGRQGLWRANLTGFYVQRVDQQLSEYVQRPGGDSADIFFYTDNAAAAWSAGGELEVSGTPVRGLLLEGSLGLLEARIADWTFGTGEEALDFSGNRHAHAPLVSFSTAMTYTADFGLFLRLGVTGMSSRFLSNNNLIEAPAHALVDARLGWKGRHVGFSVWARNLTDTTYAAAGFGPFFAPNEHVPFGNYFRLGDPATYGVAIEASL